MPDSNQVALTKMRGGQSGIVVRIDGGYGLVDRLGTMGIMPGKKIAKITSMLMRGPVTVEVDRTQIALGFGMAKRVIVQVANEIKD